ncbi:MAG: hypothetical protein GVY18_07945 [Bacteroidetes bacterium]|jgi:hypothetical protein|nr:hypothetical protein [Bacteroidota bacterium]
MALSRHPHQVVLLSSGFQYTNRRLLFSKARLFPDRIELSGWDFVEKHRQEIPLDTLCRVEWHTDEADAPDLILHLKDGDSVSLSLHDADRWRESLQQRLRWTAPDRAPLPTSSTRPDLPLNELIMYTTSMG